LVRIAGVADAVLMWLLLTGIDCGSQSNDSDDASGSEDVDSDADDGVGANGVPQWMSRLMNASTDARESQTDKVVVPYFRDIMDESGNVMLYLVLYDVTAMMSCCRDWWRWGGAM
jgi:hypothetical protein